MAIITEKRAYELMSRIARSVADEEYEYGISYVESMINHKGGGGVVSRKFDLDETDYLTMYIYWDDEMVQEVSLEQLHLS